MISNSKPLQHTGAIVGRLAPSPTGYLHLGNAWAFLCAWLGMRSRGGRLIMRIEDIDPQRSKPEYIHALCEDLRWLGLDWDAGPGAAEPEHPCDQISDAGGTAPAHQLYQQSGRLHLYRQAMLELEKRGLAYPCFCTRKELRSLAGAPQAGEPAEVAYPGICRGLGPEERASRIAKGHNYSWRLRFQENFQERHLAFDDLVYGRVKLGMEQTGGDFAVCRSDGVFAYQLAVVLDDIAMGVNQIVRGVDIITSTPRQLFLYDLFDAPPPEYAHVPLVLDHEGERLAKRHASISLRGLRESGVRPEAVIGWLACWSGLRNEVALRSAGDLLNDFSFSAIKHEPDLLPPDIADILRDLSR
ncbi:tRNA glutamyl-Q(34) synthetase GluQRS [Desulfovibrio sp. OttesenSCG-928-C06]|nr:tRNA glutamyl-Q(34) synthetase GluQRS [Desulfovibrio sp. OttesenSCG-928-C06]